MDDALVAIMLCEETLTMRTGMLRCSNTFVRSVTSLSHDCIRGDLQNEDEKRLTKSMMSVALCQREHLVFGVTT